MSNFIGQLYMPGTCFRVKKRVFVCSVDCKQSVLVPQPETVSHSRLGET